MSVSNISSNLDVDSLVSSLLKPYQASINKVNKDISATQVSISNIGKIQSGLSELKDSVLKIENSEINNLTITDIKDGIKSFVKEYNEAKELTKSSSEFGIKRFTEKFRKDLDPMIASNLGISFDKTGLMKFDEVKFDNEKNRDEVTLKSNINTLFDNVVKSNSALNNSLGPTSELDYTKELLNKRIESLNNKKEKISNKMEFDEERYRKQFTALQTILNQFSSKENIIVNFNKGS